MTILVAGGTLWVGTAVAEPLTLARSEPMNKATGRQQGEQSATAKKGRNPLGAEAAAERQGAAASRSKNGRPACPKGWTDFQNPVIGMQAHVPANYWVRLRGGLMLTVEKQDDPATAAFLVPMKPRAGTKPGAIAERFASLAAQAEPRFRAQLVGEPTADLARSRFNSFAGGQATEGKYCTLLAAGGTMAYVIGISAPQGSLAQEQPLLEQIAQGFGFVPARGKWINYQSPAGGFTLTMPEGWLVESGDGRSGKDDIDWVVRDPQRPLSRAFQWCPRFCSAYLLQDPMHAMRGYQAGEFQNHEQVIVASLGQISQNPKLLKQSVNQELTRLFRSLNQQTSQWLSAMNIARSDITVYNCLAQAQADGQAVTVAMVAGINTMVISGGLQPLTDLRVTLRGWCAEPAQFVMDTPVLERICSSMQLSAAFLQRIVQGDQQAADKIRETYDYMNKVDNQIRQNHWDTMDAIAEMNYDTLRESGGYVNEKTGRIEQIPPEIVVRNSRGERVSLEEVRRGVDREQATVLRDAYSNDYMRGVYGRAVFSY